MKRIGYSSLAVGLFATALFASAAFAQLNITCPGNTPIPNGAVLQNVFNDCPGTTRNLVNNYPSFIQFDDALDCIGGANRYVYHLSADGGQTPAQFENCSHYRFGAHVILTGSASCEAGLLLSPWWSMADGQFMINGATGEIACFGGRLPFYSFTANQGLHYTKGQDVYMEMIYDPRALTSALPATILYKIYMNGQIYFSPYLPFDEGTTAEGHGSWGELTPAYPGGYVQANSDPGGALVDVHGYFYGFQFEGPTATPTQTSTWGHIKSLYR